MGLKPVEGGLGGPDNTGCALTPVTQREGVRWSSADGYLKPASGRPNLTVLSGRRAERIMLDPDGRATGVRLADRAVTARREVVLCAGSVGSPHLRLAWDPANFVQVGIRPYTDGYAALRPHLEYLQVKDALLADATVVPAGLLKLPPNMEVSPDLDLHLLHAGSYLEDDFPRMEISARRPVRDVGEGVLMRFQQRREPLVEEPFRIGTP